MQETSPQPSGTRPVVAAGEPWVALGWQHLVLARPDGEDAHVLAPDVDTESSDGDVGVPDWSPDGEMLAFDHWVGDAISIWTSRADGTGARQVGSCASPCLQLDYPSWSPDGSRILVVAYDQAPEGTWPHTALQVLDPATGARTTVLETSDPTRTFRYPRWSPDGRSVVFQYETYRDGLQKIEDLTACVIAVADVAGTPSQLARVITPPAAWAGYPDWSPGGDRIVYSTYDLSMFQESEVVSNLYTMRPDGSDVHQVTKYGKGQTRATQPDWSDDGSPAGVITFTAVGKPRLTSRSLAFVRPDGSDLVVVAGVNGTHNRRRPTP